MKFTNLLVISIIAILSFASAKKKHHRTIDNVPSQFTRRYEKPFPDPSTNPLPREYFTGPISNPAPIAPAKYGSYNRYIATTNNYMDTTGMNIERGNGRPVAKRLIKKRKLR